MLQYLWNKYGCGDCDQGEHYFELAVDEMRHLTWMAAYVPGLADPVAPPVPSEQVQSIGSATDANKAAAQLEQQAVAFFSAKLDEAKSETLRDDLKRVLGQHEYHRHELEELD